MDPTVALPLVMPGRFGVVCRPAPDSEGPFDEGTHCVTQIPTKEILREWAELSGWPSPADERYEEGSAAAGHARDDAVCSSRVRAI